jgi:hypothetical protein
MHKAVSVLFAGLIVVSTCASGAPREPATSNPGIACGEAIARNPDFAPINGKIFLGNPANQPADMLNISDKATDAEKSVISAWLSARQACFRQSIAWVEQQGSPKEYLSLLGDINASAIARTEDLLAGRLTYGGYAKARRDLIERAKIETERLQRYLRAQ